MTQQTDHVPDGRKKGVTAVEWLIENLKQFRISKGEWNYDWEDITYVQSIIEQAKAIEKEQLNIARLDGINLANKGYGK